MTIEEIIAKLSAHPFADQIYVGKDYTKADLIADLRVVEEEVDALAYAAAFPGVVT